MFFGRIDPTQVDGQGGDWGTQYRTGVYCHTDEQETSVRTFMIFLYNEREYGSLHSCFFFQPGLCALRRLCCLLKCGSLLHVVCDLKKRAVVDMRSRHSEGIFVICNTVCADCSVRCGNGKFLSSHTLVSSGRGFCVVAVSRTKDNEDASWTPAELQGALPRINHPRPFDSLGYP